jgi:hypothetical protein
MGYRPPTRIPVRMEIIKPSNGGPGEYKMIYEDDPPAPPQPSTNTPGSNTPQPDSTVSDEGYGVPSEASGASSESLASSTSFASPLPPDYDRHSRRCCVCSHPDRDAIEGDFVRWRSPKTIAEDYHLSDRSSFYRHAHATGLFARRRREFARVLEDILECVEHSTLEETADVIIRAARVYAHLDENGNWIEPTRTHIILTGPAPPQFTGNPDIAISAELESDYETQEITLNPAKKRTYTCKSKQELTTMAIRRRKAKKNLIATHHNSKNEPSS